MRFALFALLAGTCAWLVAARANAEQPVAIEWKSGTSEQTATDERGRLRLAKSDDGYASQGSFTSTVLAVKANGKSRIGWIEQWTAPQKWRKHPGNPIYGPSQSGSWDKWTNGVSIVRNSDGETYKMFYAGRAGAGIGFAEARIDDPLSWKEHPASPVLKPLNNWEGNSINQPRVVKVSDTHWRMYYTGWGYKHPNGGSPWAFNLAESFDAGVTWKRHGAGPLLERGDAASADGGGVFVPEVRKIGDRWMMWYTALQVAEGKQNIHLCLATSDDGIHWTKHERNPVLTDDFSTGPARNVISRCFVRHEGGVYQMWYSHAKPDYRIKYAESLDGVDWERSPVAPVLDAGPAGAWDSKMVEYPEVDVVGDEWRLWFCGNGFGSVGFARGQRETSVAVEFRTGAAATPDDNWTAWQRATHDQAVALQEHVQLRIVLASENPLLSPAVSGLQIVAD